VAEPDPIRQTVIQKAAALLAAIVPPEYPIDIGPTRVHTRDILIELVEPPALAIVQRTESVKSTDVNSIFLRSLMFNVGFVDRYAGPNPDEHALMIIACIERAMAFQFDIAVTPMGADPPPTILAPIAFYLQGSAINVGEPRDGRVFGQVDYQVEYATNRRDPRRL